MSKIAELKSENSITMWLSLFSRCENWVEGSGYGILCGPVGPERILVRVAAFRDVNFSIWLYIFLNPVFWNSSDSCEEKPCKKNNVAFQPIYRADSLKWSHYLHKKTAQTSVHHLILFPQFGNLQPLICHFFSSMNTHNMGSYPQHRT